jgi:PPM family protein phosphatase
VIESSGLSSTGPVREENQDTIHLPGNISPAGSGILFAVADGMGGYAHGGMASQLALQTLLDGLQAGSTHQIAKMLRRSVENANLAVYKTAEKLGAGRMGTTLTAAYLLGDRMLLVHIGDSRAYLVRNQQATCLTVDHTTVGDMVRSRLISPERVRTHAQRSILTRAVGISLFVKPDVSEYKLSEGDTLILCSDGVWSMVLDDEFAAVVQAQPSLQQACETLIELALKRGSDDNASIVAFRIRSFEASPAFPEPPRREGWFSNRGKTIR